MERFLTADEMARLNAALTRQEFRYPDVVAIVRLLMLTGCRFSEIAVPRMGLDQGQAHLPAGFEIGTAHGLAVERRAQTVIDAIPRYGDDCPYLFPGQPADAARRQHRLPLEAHPRRSGSAGPAAA